MSIGDRVKECRVKVGLSAEQVAAQLGISAATEYRYENGDISKMPAKLIAPLASLLSTSPAYLMGWSDDDVPDKNDSLKDDEKHLVTLYRGAEETAKEIAMETLANHQKKAVTESNQTA